MQKVEWYNNLRIPKTADDIQKYINDGWKVVAMTSCGDMGVIVVYEK